MERAVMVFDVKWICTLGVLLCASSIPASAATITASVNALLYQTGIGQYGSCSAGDSASSGSADMFGGVSVSINSSSMNCDFPVPQGRTLISANMGILSGGGGSQECDPFYNQAMGVAPHCSGDVSLDGYYLFEGSGIQTVYFGQFYDNGSWGYDSHVWIGGAGVINQQMDYYGGSKSLLVTLQLGQIYAVHYSASMNVYEDGGFSYNFNPMEPGTVMVTPVATPEPRTAWTVASLLAAITGLTRRKRS